MLLDINTNPAIDAFISAEIFNGDIGWSGGAGSQINLGKSSIAGDIYRAADSTLKFKKSGELLGTDYAAADMSRFIADVDAAVASFGMLEQDLDLGAINQQGGLTIDRTDQYTVVDMSEFKLTSGTLTLNGEANDIFYIRVRDVFELNNVDVVVNGTDASRVFFIYEGAGDLEFKNGDFAGTIVAPNASVMLAGISRFDGSVISGNGFSVDAASKISTFEHVAAIPESTALGLVTLVGCAGLFIHRFFKFRKADARS